MKLQLAAIPLMFLLGSPADAQITVENPQHLELPEQRAQVLHRIICHVVADELHIRGAKTEFPVILVLGEPEERIGVDDDGMPRKIYLMRWDEASFAISDMQLAVQRAVIRDHWQQMTNEVLRRWKQVAPVQHSELNGASRSFR